jgi:hypothetical protein
MKTTLTLTLSTLLAALGAGCASSGPNTRQGAVGGAVAGAVIGGIVGHQSGETGAGAAIGAAAGGATGAAVGNKLDRDRGTTDVTPTDRGYTIAEPPPMPSSQPREVIPAQPAREAVWIRGQWAYSGRPGNPMSGWEVIGKFRRPVVGRGFQGAGNAVATATFTSAVIGNKLHSL